MPDDTPLILQILAPLEGLIEDAADLAYIIRQDSQIIGMLAGYARKHGIGGLVKWLESTGDGPL